MELQRSLADFEPNGIALFAISYDAVDVLAAFAARHSIGYPLLSDAGSRAITELGLLNQHLAEQSAVYGVEVKPHYYGVPYPGVFVLDAGGKVEQKRFFQSYREREVGVALLEQGFGVSSSVHGQEARAAAGGVSVRAHLDSDTYRFFQRLWLTVELSVAPGLHIYGQPVPEGMIAAAVEADPPEGIVPGEPVWPRPAPFRMGGLDGEFFVYTGTVRCTLPVTFQRREGDVTLPVTVRFQACSETDCLMPQAVTLHLRVSNRPLVG